MAITLRSPPQDAFAWVLDALRRNGVYVDSQGTGTKILPAVHAWQYDQVDLADGEFVLVMPTARLLAIGASVKGDNQDYVSLAQHQGTMRAVNRIEATMVRSRKQIDQLKIGSTPIERSVSMLRQQIGKGE